MIMPALFQATLTLAVLAFQVRASPVGKAFNVRDFGATANGAAWQVRHGTRTSCPRSDR